MVRKISHMSSKRIPRLILGAWIQKPRRNGKAGRSQNTIRHGYVRTLEKLGYCHNFEFSNWMKDARELKVWSVRVENFLSLP